MFKYILIFCFLTAPLFASGEQVSSIPSSNVLIGGRTLPVCLQALRLTSNKYEKTRNENNEIRSKLAECQGNRTSITDKLGYVAIGTVVAYTAFNPISLIAAGWLLIFN